MPKRIRGDWPTDMTFNQLVKAAELWHHCEYNTAEIAKALNVGEHDVYNNMQFIHAAGAIDGWVKARSKRKARRQMPV